MDLFYQSKRDLDRITRIMNVLVKFQMGQWADKIRIEEKLPIRLMKYKKTKAVYLTPPERVRLMVEELGTTFIKFGQLLSTRGDIIGSDYAVELAKLQDQTKPFPSDQAKRIVEEELGQPIEELFSSFEDKPMASASVAQVHRAVLKNGKHAVVKIQRPGVEEMVKEDLRILHYLAYLADKHIPELKQYDPEYLVNEFDRSITKELDFLREAKSALRLKENFKDDKTVYIPTVYDEMCTRRVLIMEEARGTKLAAVVKSASKKFDKKLIAHRCTQAFFKMVLIDGFYHADMHPGNIMVLRNNVICFLDYGRVGTIDKDVAENIFRMAQFVLNNDVNGLISHLVRTGMLSESIDMASLKEDLADLFDAYYSPKMNDVKMGRMFSDFVTVVGKYEFNRPRELAELARSLLLIEGVGLELNYKFSIAQEFIPFANKSLRQQVTVKSLGDIVTNNLLDLEYMAKTLPSTLRRFLSRLDEGKIKIELEHKELSDFLDNMVETGNKISISLILASVILGSSFIVQADRVLGLVCFTVAVLIGIVWVLKTLLQ